jgi:hypothetical protein
MASARTGPPWPRNCAKAGVIPNSRIAGRAAQIKNAGRCFLREWSFVFNFISQA